MQEEARKQRNTQRMKECFPAFAARLVNVIKDMETAGFRPRIQDAHRSIADQLKAFESGNSTVTFGFHNVTGKDGRPESLAVDLIDDDHPLSSGRKYVITLAAIAQRHGLHSGIFFFSGKLPAARRTALKADLQKAIDAGNVDPKVKIGFDPTHIEATGVTIAAAKAGKRPD